MATGTWICGIQIDSPSWCIMAMIVRTHHVKRRQQVPDFPNCTVDYQTKSKLKAIIVNPLRPKWNGNHLSENIFKLDMSTARRRLKSPRWLSGTSAHPTKVTLVNIMVKNGWLTSFSFHVNWPPHFWDKAISDSDLETPRSMSWVWSKGNAIQSAQYHINSLPFHFTSIRPTIPKIQLFQNLTLKHPRSWSWMRSKVKVISYPASNQCTSFLFHINQTNHSWDMAKIVFDLEKTHPKFSKKIC